MKRFVWLMVMFMLSVLVLTSGCARKKKLTKTDLGPGTVEDVQLAALKGEDIPLSETPEGETFIEPSELDKSVFEDVRFDYDDATIKDTEKGIIEGISEWMREHDAVNLMIEGHCDERGSREYNMSLGEKRALNVRRYLVSLGIDETRLFTISYGKEKPLDPGHTEEAWSKNRRAHFLISAE